MVNIFETAIQRLIELGFYNFLLPFILFVTLFYALLRKTQILGDSAVIHGVMSVTLGLFIFGMPVVLGVSLVEPLTAFLTQSAVVILVFVIGFLMASFFYPNLMESLPNIFRTPGPATWIVWVVLAFSVIFGLFVLTRSAVGGFITQLGISKELFLLSAVFMGIFLIFLLISLGKGGE